MAAEMSVGVLNELQRFRLIVEHASNMVVITDAQRRIEYVNPAYTRVTGWTLDEARGQKPGRLLHGPLTDAESIRQMSQALNREEPIDGVEVVRTHSRCVGRRASSGWRMPMTLCRNPNRR